MGRFNLTNITRNNKADINVVSQNFNKIEQNALTSTEITSMIDTAKNQAVTAAGQNAAANYYSKGQTDIYLNLKKNKSDFATVNGNIIINSNAQDILNINYPSGFDINNCVLISFGIKTDAENAYSYNSDTDDLSVKVSQVSGKLNILLKNLSSLQHTYYCRAVLMKIS